jgi:hypothetical protein
MIRVDLDEMLPLIGHVFVAIDRFDGTGRLAGAAINTLIRMDEKLPRGLEISLILTGVNAVDGADVNTSRVLRADAGFANYVNSHYASLLPQSSYWISGELNKNADSIGTVIVPVHSLFASDGTQSNPATTFSKIAQEFSAASG